MDIPARAPNCQGLAFWSLVDFLLVGELVLESSQVVENFLDIFLDFSLCLNDVQIGRGSDAANDLLYVGDLQASHCSLTSHDLLNEIIETLDACEIRLVVFIFFKVIFVLLLLRHSKLQIVECKVALFEIDVRFLEFELRSREHAWAVVFDA